MRANLALGHFEREQAGESERVLINMYDEPNGGDPSRPVRLVTTPGTMDVDTGNVIQGNIRGFAQSDAFAGGKVLILDGTTLRTWVPSTGTYATITGTVTGTDRADLAFTQTELAILSGGSIYVSAGSTIAVAGDADFPTGITSIATYNQRIIMTTGDGKWYYTAVLDIDNITGLQFYSAEAQPDNLIAVRVMGSTILLFGTKTVELWFGDAGNANDPFSRQSNVIPKGCLCRDGIQVLDSSVIWVAEDRTIRQWSGGAATVISEPWITRALEGTSAADIVSSQYEADGHAFYCLNTPTICVVRDLLTGEWHLRKSNASDTWAWSQIISQDGSQYAAKRTGSTFVHLSRAYDTDEQVDASTFNLDITREWTAHIPHEAGRPALGPIILEGSKGIGNASGDGANPVVQMRISTDNGNTWTSYRSRSMGATGAYDTRAKWNQNGRGKRPQTILQFKVAEPVKFDVTGVVYGDAS